MALLACSCGGGPSSKAPVRESEPPDSLSALAGEVERRFVEASQDTTPEGRAREEALEAARSLALAVLARQRPASGWSPPVLEGALRERGLAPQVREVARGKEPWLLLLSDSRRPDTPAIALLVYPESGSSFRLDVEPFLHPFQLAAWKDAGRQALLVAGVRRSPAGPQPVAWLFRLPGDAPKGSPSSPPIAPAGTWGLAAAGRGEVAFRFTDPDSAPRISVRASALPNPLFDECLSCPHVEADVEFRLDGLTLVPMKRVVHRTPYSAFVSLVEALVNHDEPAASGLASRDAIDTALRLGLDRVPESGRWRIAPGVSASSLDQVYLRGQEGAFRVQLAPGDTGYVVTSIAPTTFSLD